MEVTGARRRRGVGDPPISHPLMDGQARLAAGRREASLPARWQILLAGSKGLPHLARRLRERSAAGRTATARRLTAAWWRTAAWRLTAAE